MIDRETGEVISEETYSLIKKDVDAIQVFDQWLDAKEQLLTAKERFDMVDKPFREELKKIFQKYSISRFYNDYIDVQSRKGYTRMTFDTDKVEQYIREHGDDPEAFKKGKYIADTLSVKYRDE